MERAHVKAHPPAAIAALLGVRELARQLQGFLLQADEA